MKRNDIVVETDGNDLHRPYGRVIRMVHPRWAEVIFCTRNIRFESIESLRVINDYKGCWEVHHRDPVTGEEIKRWYPMPTLRQLKQGRSHYDKTVWRNRRPKYERREC